MLTTGQRSRRTGSHPERRRRSRREIPARYRGTSGASMARARPFHAPRSGRGPRRLCAIGEKLPQRFHAPRRRAGLPFERPPAPAPPSRLAPLGIPEKAEQRFREILLGRDANGLMGAKIVGDRPEICVVWPHHNGNAKLGRLQWIMPARRHQAALRQKPPSRASRPRPARRSYRAERGCPRPARPCIRRAGRPHRTAHPRKP